MINDFQREREITNDLTKIHDPNAPALQMDRSPNPD